jgi:protein-tyrosine-phosphatase
MDVLFVCRNNTGRSQVAMEFFRRLSSNKTSSGGTQVELPNLLVGERPGAVTTIQAMREYGIDMTSNKRVQLTEENIEGYDKIVVMAERSLILAVIAAALTFHYGYIYKLLFQ